MKRKVLACALLVIGYALIALSTTAYFNDQTTATNVITAGTIDVEIHEMSILEEGSDPVKFENPIGIVPGDRVSKIVTVENVGGQEAFIRIKVEKKILLAKGQEGEVDPSLIEYDINDVDWTYQEGWYYYNIPLESGMETAPLMTYVQFSLDMDNLYQKSVFELNVIVQATQVANNNENVLEAVGWPQDE